MANRANQTNPRRGATLVEFTLTFLLFLVIVLTLLEMGRGIWTYTTLAHAARQAGRYAMVHGTENIGTLTGISDVAARHAQGLDTKQLTVSTQWNPRADTPKTDPSAVQRGDIVEVKLTYPFRLVTSPIVLKESTFTMSSTSRMVVAN